MEEKQVTSPISFTETLEQVRRSLKIPKGSVLQCTNLNAPSWKPTDIELLKSRILAFCIEDGACWLFRGSLSKKGYGTIRVGGREKGKLLLAHRASFRAFHGPIPSGKMICHTCDRPACVHPGHLYAGTALENNRDREDRGRRDVKGVRHHNSKLTDQDIYIIRAGGKTDAEFGRMFHVDRALIRRIRLRKSWTHLP